MAGLTKLMKGCSMRDTQGRRIEKHFFAFVSNVKDLDQLGNSLDKFTTHVTTSHSDFNKLLEKHEAGFVLLYSGSNRSPLCKHIGHIRKKHPCAFIVVADPTICSDADARLDVVHYGANMVTELESDDLHQAIEMVAELGGEKGSFQCPYCHAKGFTQHDLWLHCPLYHINVPNSSMEHSRNCPVCSGYVSQTPMMVHIHENHGPFQQHGRSRPKLYSFALVVCRRPSDGKFLLVQEFGSEGYFLPGGAVDYCENLTTAAIRETKEEAGVDVNLTGILSIIYSPYGSYVRLCAVFVASPKDESQRPKTMPDFESAGAVWVSAEEIPSLKLRGKEPLLYINEKYCKGAIVHPLSLLEVY